MFVCLLHLFINIYGHLGVVTSHVNKTRGSEYMNFSFFWAKNILPVHFRLTNYDGDHVTYYFLTPPPLGVYN